MKVRATADSGGGQILYFNISPPMLKYKI